MYPIARDLKKAGNHVIVIMGARNRELLFWEDKMTAASDELIICTDDGSYGRKALVTEPLKELLTTRPGEVVKVWAIGPTIMMKFVSFTTQPFNVPTIVSLNSIMIDGTGMCGGCRVAMTDGAKCLRGWPGVRWPPGGLGQPGLPRPILRDEEQAAVEHWQQVRDHECNLGLNK